MADRELIGVLASRLRDTLAGLVPARSTVAVIGFPNHSNPGDSAIWLGVLAGLRDLDCRVAYACDFHTYDRGALRRAVGSGPILITGGGNFGDLYPPEQELRERVVTDFADSPIVQLPQSVHFRDAASIDRARGVFRSHERFSLIVRDIESRALVERELGIEPVLAPDCAFLLGPLARPAPASEPITVLRRKDGEAVPADAAIDGVVPVDWMDEPARALERASVRVRHYARDHYDHSKHVIRGWHGSRAIPIPSSVPTPSLPEEAFLRRGYPIR